MGFRNLLKKINEPQNNAAFICINLLLGTGPLIVPEPFFRAGFCFSTVWTIFVIFISYNAALYIGQSIELLNKYQARDSLISRAESDLSLISAADDEHKHHDDKPGPAEQEGHAKTITTFDHSQQFSLLFGQKYLFVPVLAITVYLFGVLISKCIMTGKVLSKLMGDIDILNTFQFWLIVFFLIGGGFSFKSIEKTKVIQVIMISVRFISIMLLLVGSFVIMGQNGGVKDLAPEGGNAYFNSAFFEDVFSNLIFTFMVHHSLPGITKQLTKLSDIRYFMKIGFLVAGTTVILLPITASLAFGNELIGNNKFLMGEHHLKYYNEDYKGRIDFVYYFVSFYVFLNVAAFSVYIIVIRKNVLAIARPEMDSDKLSKTTMLITGVLLGLLLIISYLLRDDIQIVLDFTGGILGSFNLLIMPSLQVYKARKLFPPQKSFLNSYVWMPIFIASLGMIAIVYNLYKSISNLVQ